MKFVRFAFTRVNPVLPPRRKRETAQRHLLAVRVVHRWLAGMANYHDRNCLPQWAASIVLDAGSVSRNTVPPGFGTADWNASDGVLKHTLKLAAQWLLRERDHYHPGGNWTEEQVDKAWSILHSDVWEVCTGFGTPTPEKLTAALRSMELVDPPNALYWIQVHAPVSEIKPLADNLGLPIPETEGFNGTFPIGFADGDNITRGEGDDCVITIQRESPIPSQILCWCGMYELWGSKVAPCNGCMAPTVHVDTMAVGHERQPQFRGPAGELAAIFSRSTDLDNTASAPPRSA